MVFTASHANYAQAVADYLDPRGEIIAHQFSRESCFNTEEGFYVKDLRAVDRELSNVLLIDNVIMG
jgi:CTD small phosphatase-like protein 2